MTIDCLQPSNTHFHAPSNDTLLPYNIAGRDISSGTSSSSTTSTTSEVTSRIFVTVYASMAASCQAVSTAGPSSPSNTSSGNKLTVGTKAGIGIGIVTGALVTLLVVLTFLSRRRRDRRRVRNETLPRRPLHIPELQNQTSSRKEPYEKPELPTNMQYTPTWKLFLHNLARADTGNKVPRTGGVRTMQIPESGLVEMDT
ncbi:MAG: hypothetical protein Q9160_004704 [Pyrenula sp. 1 TL-2023]